MNANGFRNAGWAIALTVITTGTCQQTPAAPPSAFVLTPLAVGQSAGDQGAERLSVRDVDHLLKQAKQAINNGDLDRAEALVRRCENANVRYPLLHFGPKPAAVRRELTQAQRALAARNPSAVSRPSTMAARNAAAVNQDDEEFRDPFAIQASATLSQPLSQPDNLRVLPTTEAVPLSATPVPQSGVMQTAYPQTGGAGNTLGDLADLGPASANPFKSRNPQEEALSSAESLAATLPADELGLDMGDAAESAEPASMVEGSSPISLPTAPITDLEATAPPPPSVAANTKEPPMPAVLSTPSPQMSATADAPMPNLGSRYESGPQEPVSDKQKALALMHEARQAMLQGDLATAEAKVQAASALNVPESRFLPGEDRPSALAWDIQQVRQLPAPPGNNVQLASSEDAATTQPAQGTPALHVAEDDSTYNVPAASRTPGPDALRFAQLPGGAAETSPAAPQGLEGGVQPASRAAQLLEEGENALRNNDRATALRLFQQAQQQAADLDPLARQRLEGHLQMFSPNAPSPLGLTASSPASSQLSAADERQQALARQLQAEVTKRQTEAQSLRESAPKRALDLLKETRQQITDSELNDAMKSQLVRRLDISIGKTEDYIEQHRAEIELDEQNAAVLAEIDRSRAVKVKVQQDIADLVNQFNQLRDEHRYEEMEVVAQRLRDLAPEEPVVQQVWQDAKFLRRTVINQELAMMREDANWNAWNDVERSSIQNVGDGRELVFGDAKEWEVLTRSRRKSGELNGRMSERELEIRRRLETPVLLRYEERPLSEVINGLSELTGVNIHLDQRGLSHEDVSTDTPVTISLNKEISLKSALSLILSELHLTYVISDEVLKITSEQMRDGELKPVVYPVADLVIPIPNFVPTNSIGLQGLLNDAHAAMGYGMGGFGAPGPVTLVNNTTAPDGTSGGGVLAQQFSSPRTGVPNPTVPVAGGPGGLGGAASADFDSLIDLIISTVATETWAENGGGEAEVRAFPTNLSLVVSQTQAVHEEIADLLEQLRRLQDLQVTIEVRFIRLNDDFFERIGIDFDMNVEDSTGISTVAGFPGALTPGAAFEPRRRSATVGINPETGLGSYPNYTTDLDVHFRQNGFDLTAPSIGGLTSDVAGFGFAILSDLEATFLINAVQGDSRTNVLNAPKVTLFNGQQAFVADTTQVPFVISVIPVVGEFASAQQPVIVVLSEGTLMSIQAVVSDDRRYVRLTVVPFFSDIGDVDTFTFEGSSSSTSSSSSSSSSDDGEDESESATVNNTVGTTVQLPEFSFVSVVTTVSVPDGGTVLLGGIKRLSEGRDERGIPLLSKVPYVNRLFRNVGIGRATDSLMMMVTPRIIILEEEEEKLGIQPSL